MRPEERNGFVLVDEWGRFEVDAGAVRRMARQNGESCEELDHPFEGEYIIGGERSRIGRCRCGKRVYPNKFQALRRYSESILLKGKRDSGEIEKTFWDE